MEQQIAFYSTEEHPCSYLIDKMAKTVFADPEITLNNDIYNILIQNGFRRSGNLIYKPICSNCSSCKSLRVLANDFIPGKRFRRVMRKNNDLSISTVPAAFSDEHFNLYAEYISSRHPGGEMDDGNANNYREFLLCDWSNTLFTEFRLKNKLVAVSVADIVSNGISAVYTFFDTKESYRGLGTFAILNQINQVISMKKDYLYLGYKISESQKMSYKANFKPNEVFNQHHIDKWFQE